MEKVLSPQVRCLVLSGGDRRLASEERRLQEGVVVEQVGKVGGGQIMEVSQAGGQGDPNADKGGRSWECKNRV